MAITSNVSSFLTQVKQGVRPNMFQVDITFPGTVEADQTLVSYMCKSAALPASNIGVIEVPSVFWPESYYPTNQPTNQPTNLFIRRILFYHVMYTH